MWFSKKQAAVPTGQITTKRRGDAAEALACAYLTERGLRLLERNFATPGRGGGEIDLVMRAPDGTLVFVEVRMRSSERFGGAAGSITAAKKQKLLRTARHYLAATAGTPACRFDALLLQGGDPSIEWLKNAFTE